MSRTPYPSSLTDAQRASVAPLVPPPRPGGRPAKYARRAVADGIPYAARTGRPWRSLPTDLPTYRTRFHYFRLRRADGTWGRIHAASRGKARRAAGKRRRPTTGTLDSQSARATERGGPGGDDGGKEADRPRAARGR
jgi:putative transposase